MALHCAAPTISPPARRPCLPQRRRRGGPSNQAGAGGTLTIWRLAGVGAMRAGGAVCHAARRRVRYDEGDEEDDDEEWGHSEDVARLERYTEGVRDQALLVEATVDGEVETVLVFKGFSSNLSGGTAADPARSVLPERAVIRSVDVVKGPFDPNSIEYLEKGVAWDDFKSRLP